MSRKIAKILMVAFFISGTSGYLISGEIQDHFLRVKTETEKDKGSEARQQTTLNENIRRALKMSLLRDYMLCDYQKVDISESNIEVSSENPNMYYFRYEKFAGYYIFPQDPRRYLQSPVDAKILLEPDSSIVQLNDPECKPDSSAQDNQ